jgi:RHH-type proline utilization regulon transcriptional repressor/proline dehydrogenase/delta 1-pyrroline-5-carboxylate dehydrogenase
VIQAYQKRCPAVVDWLVDLARRSGHRLMIRLVKGAYWDSEIKRAQQDGQDGYPVYTRKLHTDVSYLACARALLAAPDAIYPQFATHNAHTVAAIVQLAGANFYAGQYEFQCLHGMGEPLYEQVVGAITAGKLGREAGKGGLAPPVPHLRPRGHARNAAGLPGAPPSGKRRQHLVCEPHCRRNHRCRWTELVKSPVQVVDEQAARGRQAAGLPHPRIPLPASALRCPPQSIHAGWICRTKTR